MSQRVTLRFWCRRPELSGNAATVPWTCRNRDKQTIFQFDIRTSLWHRDHKIIEPDLWVAIGRFHYETMNFSPASLILFDIVWWLWRQRLLPSWRGVWLSELADHCHFDFNRFRKVECCRCSMIFWKACRTPMIGGCWRNFIDHVICAWNSFPLACPFLSFLLELLCTTVVRLNLSSEVERFERKRLRPRALSCNV